MTRLIHIDWTTGAEFIGLAGSARQVGKDCQLIDIVQESGPALVGDLVVRSAGRPQARLHNEIEGSKFISLGFEAALWGVTERFVKGKLWRLEPVLEQWSDVYEASFSALDDFDPVLIAGQSGPQTFRFHFRTEA